jgi:uncharacterized protein (DUF427 family)
MCDAIIPDLGASRINQGISVKKHAMSWFPATIVTSFLLGACSGDSESEDTPDAINGVQNEQTDAENDSTSEVSQTPTESNIDRPEINLPEDMNNNFEDADLGDAEQRVFYDVVQGINATDYAISESDPSLDVLEFYYIADALVDVRTYVRGAAEANDTWTGTAEYYDFSVEIPNERDAIVSYCIDTSGVQTKELDTGQVLPRAEDARDFNFTEVVLQQSEEGVWQVSRIMPRDEEKDAACER